MQDEINDIDSNKNFHANVTDSQENQTNEHSEDLVNFLHKRISEIEGKLGIAKQDYD